MFLSDAVDEINLDKSGAIQIPVELMRQANISQDAALQIACLNGCIMISQDTGIQPEEWDFMLENLQVAESLVSILPGEAR